MQLSDLKEVQVSINSLPYVPETSEDWSSIGLSGGDCDSYATRKFEELTKLGWTSEYLRLATCFSFPTGAYHCVLLADFESHTYVLDNMEYYVLRYEFCKHRWHKIQIAGTQDWETVNGNG